MTARATYNQEFRDILMPVLTALGLDQASMGASFMVTDSSADSVTIEWVRIEHVRPHWDGCLVRERPMRSTISITHETL